MKAFLDEIAEEFVDARSVKLSHHMDRYRIVVEYKSYEFNRLSRLELHLLTQAQRRHLAKELSEILINISSHSGH